MSRRLRMGFSTYLRAFVAFVTSLSLAIGTLPAAALAEATEPDETGLLAVESSVTKVQATYDEPLHLTIEQEGDSDPGALFDAYVQKRLYEPIGQPGHDVTLYTQDARKSLEGLDLRVYDWLRGIIDEVVAGKHESTVFSIPVTSLVEDVGPWTAEDLGIATFGTDTKTMTAETMSAVLSKVTCDYGRVLEALLCDCPYELYWMDKTSGADYNPFSTFEYVIDGSGRIESIEVGGDIGFQIYVSADFSPGHTEGTSAFDTSIVEAIDECMSSAQQIVSLNAGKSPAARIRAYAEAICGRVSYNRPAAEDDNMPYGNPWQLLWVFDNDPNTNVVCEGYAKAFKYLCDLTWPDREIECITVSGGYGVTEPRSTSVTTEAHMWNMVRMDDGASYLCDVTNCDEGSVGAPDRLLMAYGPKYSSGGVTLLGLDDKYTVYVYDELTMGLFSEEELTIASAPYDESLVNVPVAHEGLVYDGTAQAGVPEGWGYELSGDAVATDAGEYVALASLTDGLAWRDGVTGSREVRWSIARRPVTVTADDKVKVAGQDDPELTATVQGTLAGDEVAYSLARDAGDDAGTYAIRATGTAEQDNYQVTFAPGTLTIQRAAMPPAAREGLVYDGTEQTGVPEGWGYVLSGDFAATGAGEYVAVATPSDGVEWWGGGSEARQVRWSIARRPVTVTADDKDKVVGQADPKLTATVQGTLAGDKVDYSLARDAGDGAGTYAIRATGAAQQGNYQVTFAPGTLTIGKAAIAKCDISAIPDQAYTGKAIAPEVLVSFGGRRLASGRDYALQFRDNVGPGTATATITGQGDYVGTRAVTFGIVVPPVSFRDVDKGAWYAGVVARAVAVGLFSGYSDGRFGPYDGVTRGQVATVLWRMAGTPAPGSNARSFSDVDGAKYYARAVNWAGSVGVVNGYADGRFGPEDPVTREQLAAMVANYASRVAGVRVEGSAADFASMRDASQASAWAARPLGWCFRNGVLSGTGDGRINPQGGATRAQAAKMLLRLQELAG